MHVHVSTLFKNKCDLVICSILFDFFPIYILGFISDQHRQTYLMYFLVVGEYSTVLLNDRNNNTQTSSRFNYTCCVIQKP